ncbi:hypothetical protein BSKO_07420 [Bryopsis sp. KO-2023]|nr:hypothetical protein BSKO_07420 [Bryopsis sp. KO-2023]
MAAHQMGVTPIAAPTAYCSAHRLGGLHGRVGKPGERFAPLPSLRRIRSLDHRHVATSTVTPSDTVATLPATEERNAQNGDQPEFDWFKNWYPVQFTRNLDDDRPNRIQLLGRWYVAWKGLSGNWNVMDDQCPHRLAPLSEGRVEKDGNLLCAYHAWRFDESGKCVRIPQADSAKAECTACDSGRSRVTKYPSKVLGGMLWVWPDSSVTCAIDSEASPVPIKKEVAELMDQLEEEGNPTGYTRVMPYSHDVLVENLIDPAHITISHHGALPNFSRYDAKSLNMSHVENEPSDYKKDVLVTVKYDIMNLDGILTFAPPCHVEQWVRGVEGRSTMIHTVPLEPGKSRLFFTQEFKSSIMRKWPLNVFPWLDHLWHHNIFDGDNVFLNVQDRNMRSAAEANGTDLGGGSMGGSESFFMATSADSAVRSFRKWFDTVGMGGPPFPGGQRMDGGELQKEELLDRFEQHTKECKECQGALKMIDLAGVLARVALVGCFGGLCAMVGLYGIQGLVSKVWPALGGLGLLVGLAAAETARRFLDNFRQQFFFVDYSHADHD